MRLTGREFPHPFTYSGREQIADDGPNELRVRRIRNVLEEFHDVVRSVAPRQRSRFDLQLVEGRGGNCCRVDRRPAGIFERASVSENRCAPRSATTPHCRPVTADFQSYQQASSPTEDGDNVDP